MVQEIIYTSAEKGLKQGSRGFCTVVATAGIPINLAERLESMSGYRQLIPLGDPRAALNPVAWSHITTRIAGQSLHVVSRVADAGQDYTGRSNKLAHHLAFGDSECTPVGPARLLTHPGIVVERWNGEIKNVSPRQLPQIDTPETIHLTAWHAVTGDHGWAGSIAEQLASSPVPVHVIFPLGTNTLLLTQEVLDLLPPAQRWEVTFSTYFTRLLAGTECQLRFIPDDTAEATAVRNDARAKVVDLTKPLPPASGGNLVSLARTAIIKTEHTRPATSLAGSPATAIGSATTTGSRHAPTQPTLTPAPGGKATKQSMTLANRQPSLLPDLPDAASRRGRFFVIGAITVLLMVATIIVILATHPDNNDAYTALAGHNPNSGIPNAEAIRAQRELLEEEKAARDKAAMEDAAAAKKAADLVRQAEEEKQKTEQEQQRLAQEQHDRIKRDKQDAQRAALEKAGPFALLGAAVAAKDPKWSDGRGQWLFELPKPQHNQSSAQLPLRLHGQLLELAFLEAATQILPKDLLLPSIRKDDSNPDTWQLTATVGGQSVPLGSYRLNRITPANDTEADAQLQFTWSVDASRETEAAEIARWLPLELRVGNRKIALLQRKPESPQSLEHIPTWSSWCEGRPMTQVSTSALKAIRVTEIQLLNRGYYISDSGAPEQAIQLTVASKERLSEEQDTPATIISRYFMLSRPMNIMDRPPAPDVLSTSLGFGKIELSANDDASVKPSVSLVLRLPGRKTFIADLPSKGLNEEFQTLRRQPTIFAGIVGKPSPDGDWPQLRAAQARRLDEMRRYFSLFSSTAEWWHEQPIDSKSKLPNRNSFLSNDFTSKTADETTKTLDSYLKKMKLQEEEVLLEIRRLATEAMAVIPKGNEVGTERLKTNYQKNPTHYDQTNAVLTQRKTVIQSIIASWGQYEPAIPTFSELVRELRDGTKNGLIALTSPEHHEACGIVTSEWTGASHRGEFGVRAVIESPPIATEGFENTQSLVIVFYESTSPPKLVTPPAPQAIP